MASEHPTEHGDKGAPHGAPAHGVGHIVSPKILIASAVALLILTVLTVTAANVSFEALEITELHIIVALGIALLKASIVLLFFMHLKWDRPFNAFILVSSMALVLLFITFAMTDSEQYQPEIKAYTSSLPGGETTEIKGELDKLPPPLPPEMLREHKAEH